MKQNTLCILFVLMTVVSSAQSAFKKGDKLLNLGVGIGSPFWGSLYSASLPVNPTLTYEAGISDEISVGGTVSYSSSKWKNSNVKFNAIYIGARGAYHFDISKENIDLYAGAGLGYVIVSYAEDDIGTGFASSGTGYSAFVGGRYYFNGKTGVYAELGYASLSVLNAGITFKF